MSLPFNAKDTDLKGIVQIYEDEIGANPGDISGNSTKLKKFTARANMALDDYLTIAIQESGEWEIDDSNHTDDYPFIYRDIVSGRRDYKFTTDETGNLILDIFKVMILPSATATKYVEITPKSETDGEGLGMFDESNIPGVPSVYGKRANALFFDPVFNYNATRGIKAAINREGSYFTYQDTTKKPGVPGLHHEYFALKPAQAYIRINGTNDDYTKITNRILEIEKNIREYFGKREKDTSNVLQGEITSFQ